MAYKSSFTPPLDTRERTSDHWFARTVGQVGTLTLAAFGIYKMRGPTGILVRNIFEGYKNKIIEREMMRQTDKSEFGPGDITMRPKHFGIDLEDPYMDEAIKAFEEKRARRPSRIVEIADKEIKIINELKTDIGEYRENAKKLELNIAQKGTEIKKVIDLERDEILYTLREDCLFDFINTSLSLNPQDREILNTLKGSNDRESRKKLADLHNSYVEGDREYAEIYSRKLARLKETYRARKNVASAIAPNETYAEKPLILSRLYGSEYLDADMSAVKHNLMADGVKYRGHILAIKDVADMLTTNQKITSGSEGTPIKFNGESFLELSKCDYAPYLRKILRHVDDLRGPRAAACQIRQIDFEFIQKGIGTKQHWYLQLTFQHKKHPGTYAVEIPVAHHGFIGGSLPNTRERADKILPIPDTYGTVKQDLRLYDEPEKGLKQNAENVSQAMMRKVIKFLDSGTMEKEFSGNPYKAISGLNTSLRQIYEKAPILENVTRDIFKIGSIAPPTLGETKYAMERIKDGISSANHIKDMSSAMKHGNAVMITIDLETISRDIPGPEHIVKDPWTQVTKAGFNTTEFKNVGAGHQMYVSQLVEMASDHGLDVMDSYDWKKETVDWLRTDGSVKEDMTDEQVIAAYKKRLHDATAESQRLNGVGKFGDNQEFVSAFADKILAEIERMKRKYGRGVQIFINTKNGTFFDLPLIFKHARRQFAKLKYEARRGLIDLQNIEFLRDKSFAGEESLALNKIIRQQMQANGAAGTDIVDIDQSGAVEKAYKFFLKKGNKIGNATHGIFQDSEIINNLLGNVLDKAHSSPGADTIFADVAVFGELQKYWAGDRSYSGLSDLQKQLFGHKTLHEKWEEYKINETRYTVHGHVTSANSLSQSQQAKDMVSTLPLDHIIPHVDNPMGKQWDQLQAGITVRQSAYFNRSKKKQKDIDEARYTRRYFGASYLSQGEIDAEAAIFGADAMTGEFSQHVVADTVFIWNSWAGQEGLSSFSQTVFDRIEAHIKKSVELTSASVQAEDVRLHHVVGMLEDETTKKAYAIAKSDAGKPMRPTDKHWEQAVQAIKNKYYKGISLQDKKFLAKGDKALNTLFYELNGALTNVIVDRDAAHKIKVFADITYSATGSKWKDIAMVYRNAGTKSALSINKWLSAGLVYGGTEAVVAADFLEKGYIGAQKELMVTKIIDKYIDDSYSKDPTIAKRAKEQLKKLSSELNSTVEYDTKNNPIRVIHDPNREVHFPHIVNPEDRVLAKKSLGNISLSVEQLHGWMADAGIIWDKNKARRWYAMWAGSSDVSNENVMARGHTNIESYITITMENARKDYEGLESRNKGVLKFFNSSNASDYLTQTETHLRATMLPSLPEIEHNSARIPMFQEPIKYWVDQGDSDSPWTPGFRAGRVRGTLTGITKGRNPFATNLKLRGNLLYMIDHPFNHVSRKTIDHLEANRRYMTEDRFLSAAKTVKAFYNALLSKKATASGNNEIKIEDINKIINFDTMAELERMKFRLDDTRRDEIVTELSKLIDEERPNEHSETIKDIIKDLQINNQIETAAKSKHFMVAQQAQLLSNLSHDKNGLKRQSLQYSLKKELGGPISFNLREVLTDMGLTEGELPGTEKKLQLFFENISNAPDGREIMEFKDGKWHLKKIIMHAEEHIGNIMDIVNPHGGKTTIGYTNNSTYHQKLVMEAIQKYEQHGIKHLGKKPSGDLLAKQWVTYMTQGFLMDSSSIYARAFEIAPRGHQVPVRGAAEIIQFAQNLLERQTRGLKVSENERCITEKYHDVLERITKNCSLSDIYVTDKLFNTMEIEHGEKITHYLKNRLGQEALDNIKGGKQPYYGYMTRHPNAQSALDAMLDFRINVIPMELGEWVGMNANEAQLHASYTKLFGADWDGDIAYTVLHSLNTSETLNELEKNHREALEKAMESNVRTSTKVMKLKDAVKKKLGMYFVSGEKGKGGLKCGWWDEHGNQVTSLVTDQDEIKSIYSDYYKNLAGNLTTMSLNNPLNATPEYTRHLADQLALVGTSKDLIGEYTNIVQKRTRTLLQVGLAEKKSPASQAVVKALIGNLAIGDAGIAQMFINLSKHPELINRLEDASRALRSPLSHDPVAHRALKGLFEYDEETKKAGIYKTWFDAQRAFQQYTKSSSLGTMASSLEDIDLMKKGTNIADLINASADVSVIKESSPSESEPEEFKSPLTELTEMMVKHFKLDLHAKVFMKRGGKYAAIGAAAYLATNFFRPHQLSNSLNPMDAFTDLGDYPDGRNNKFFSDLELSHKVPLDMVDASFSKQAYIRLNGPSKGKENQEKSNVINDLLARSFSNSNQFLAEWRSRPNLTYSNYTTNVPYFGSSQLDRRSRY